MNDFRKVMYESYVSGFKKRISPYTEKVIAETKSIYRVHFFPLLSSLSKDAKILDMGCGPGFFLETMKDWGFTNAEGIDASEEQVKIGQQRGNPVRTGDVITHLSDYTDTYDLIVAMDFIEHFTKDELVSLFQKVYTALKPGGMFLIQTPNGEAIFPGRLVYGDFTHLTIFTAASFGQLASATGFTHSEVFEKRIEVFGLKGFLMKTLWRLLRTLVFYLRALEESTAPKVMTANLIGVAKK